MVLLKIFRNLKFGEVFQKTGKCKKENGRECEELSV